MFPFPAIKREQRYKFYRIQFEDGSIRDYPLVWDSDDQPETRNQALWFWFENLFAGTMPDTPKAERIVAVWFGTQGSQPTAHNMIKET